MTAGRSRHSLVVHGTGPALASVTIMNRPLARMTGLLRPESNVRTAGRIGAVAE
jgi:hypothetical protein